MTHILTREVDWTAILRGTRECHFSWMREGADGKQGRRFRAAEGAELRRLSRFGRGFRRTAPNRGYAYTGVLHGFLDQLRVEIRRVDLRFGDRGGCRSRRGRCSPTGLRGHPHRPAA